MREQQVVRPESQCPREGNTLKYTYRFVLLGVGLFLHELLVLVQKLRMEFHVAGFVDTVHVAEACRD